MKQRITGFDWARVVAAFSIVAFHVSPYRGVVNDLAFSWAVPFFFALSGFLNVRCADYAEPSWLATRLKRLAIPYALWTTMRLVDLNPITPVTLLKQYLLCAPTSTLWFLWTLMLCVTIAWFLRKRLTVTTIAALSGVAALGYAVVCEWWFAFGPLGAWLHANPGYSLQLPFVWLWVYVGGMWLGQRKAEPGPLGFGLIAAGGALMLFWPSDPGLAYNYSWGIQGLAHGLVGLGITQVASTLALPRNVTIERVAAASLGIYLIHPALIRVIAMAADRLPAVTWVAGHTGLLWAAVSAASLAIAVVLMRRPLLKWLVI